MIRMKSLPIGISDFKKLIEYDYYFMETRYFLKKQNILLDIFFRQTRLLFLIAFKHLINQFPFHHHLQTESIGHFPQQLPGHFILGKYIQYI